MSTEGSGASRGGGDDFHNEDTFLVEEGLGLYAVCDGASTFPAGETASSLAAAALEEFVARAETEFGDDLWWGPEATATVAKGLRHAMQVVLEATREDPALEGMATTATLLLAHGRQGVIGHAGDSRAYLIRRNRGHLLTKDHELTDPVSNGGPDASIDVFSLPLQRGDTIVLCTDGAEDVVQDDDIVRVAGRLSPALLASRIVSAANRRHPDLDATAVVVRVRGESDPGWLELSSKPRQVSFRQLGATS